MKILNLAMIVLLIVVSFALGYYFGDYNHQDEPVDIKMGLEIKNISEPSIGYLIPDGKGSLKDVTKEEYEAYWED